MELTSRFWTSRRRVMAAAVTVASPGDRINVCAGTYIEQVTIPAGKDRLCGSAYGVRTAVFAADNYIDNNQMLGNREFDVHSDQTSVNRWNENNRCLTQTTPEPPPGVCSPDDVPPPE